MSEMTKAQRMARARGLLPRKRELTRLQLLALDLKIDAEGGLLEYFDGYSSPEAFAGTQLYDAAKRMVDAARELRALIPNLDEVVAEEAEAVFRGEGEL